MCHDSSSFVFFFKQKTAYELRISDWSSDVCSSDLPGAGMPPPPEVSVATVLSKPVHQWDTFNGRVTAVESVQLRPRVSGYVQRVAFDEGQEVKKGDLLFVIDPRPYQAALDQAQAQLQRARAEAKLAQAQAARG